MGAWRADKGISTRAVNTQAAPQHAQTAPQHVRKAVHPTCQHGQALLQERTAWPQGREGERDLHAALPLAGSRWCSPGSHSSAGPSAQASRQTERKRNCHGWSSPKKEDLSPNHWTPGSRGRSAALPGLALICCCRCKGRFIGPSPGVTAPHAQVSP